MVLSTWRAALCVAGCTHDLASLQQYVSVTGNCKHGTAYCRWHSNGMGAAAPPLLGHCIGHAVPPVQAAVTYMLGLVRNRLGSAEWEKVEWLDYGGTSTVFWFETCHGRGLTETFSWLHTIMAVPHGGRRTRVRNLGWH